MDTISGDYSKDLVEVKYVGASGLEPETSAM